MNNSAPTHWITQTPEQQLANIRYGKANCLPVDIPQGYEQKLQQFSFDWTQLKRVITDEAAHFAVRVSPTYLHVFTQRCAFGIDLSVPYAQVSLDETIWMTELVSLHQLKEKFEQKAMEFEIEADRLRERLDEIEEENVKLNAECDALEKANSSLLSRCMKLVRRFAKRKEARP